MSEPLTMEQKRALAIAQARLRLMEQKPQPKRDAFASLMRQYGLAGRYAIQGATSPFDMLAEPLRAAGRQAGMPSGTSGGAAIADWIGLPKPETAGERVVGDISTALAGAGGSAGTAKILSDKVVAAAKPVVDWLAANTGLQAQAAIGAGAGQGLAREANVGPIGQAAASLAGGMAVPTAARGTRMALEPVKDVLATIQTAGGGQTGKQSLVADAIERAAGEARGKIIPALQNATEFVPGAKPTVGEALAQAQPKEGGQFGGAIARLQKDLTGAVGVEDVLPTVAAQQETALAKAAASINARTAPLRNAALEGANRGGVRSKSVLERIDEILATPGRRSSDVVSKSLRAIKKKLLRFTDDSGVIDANDIYTIRKEIGSTIGKYAKENAQWDKKLTGTLERDIQMSIDDAIEAAGGKGWKEYLSNYSLEMRGIEAHKQRATDFRKMAAGVKSGIGGNVAPGEIPQPPTLLSRPMMLLNYGLRFFAKDANDPVVKELTRLLQDPKAFNEVLFSRPVRDPWRQRALEVINRGVLAEAMLKEREQE